MSKNHEITHQAGREKYLGVTPRIISDNGPQFIAKDFKHFIRLHSAIVLNEMVLERPSWIEYEYRPAG